MNYQHPTVKEENWRRTNPELFVFPERTCEPSVSIAHEGSSLPGVHIMKLQEACETFPHIMDGCERTGFNNDIARAAAEQSADGYLVYIDRAGEFGEGPAVSLSLAADLPASLKNLIIIAPGADVTLIERMDSSSSGKQLLLSAQAIIGAGATLRLKRYWNLERRAYADIRILLGEDARIEMSSLMNVTETCKIDQQIDLKEAGSSVDELFVNIALKNAHVDFSSNIKHSAPYTTSRLEARGALWDKAYSLHHGVVNISKEARGSDTYFASRSLILSPDGRADSIPKLEIATDEVKAGHGATVSDIDREAVYYLMTRGFPRKDAELLCVEGFLAPIFDRFPELGAGYLQREKINAA